jgi:hypothetical protein
MSTAQGAQDVPWIGPISELAQHTHVQARRVQARPALQKALSS